MEKINRDTVMVIYDELMENAVHQNMVKYLSMQYYYDTIHKTMKEKHGESYRPDVIRKIIAIELKRKSGKITLQIINTYKRYSDAMTKEEIVSKLQSMVPCPREYIIRVIESI